MAKSPTRTTAGAISEMRACAYLMEHGYYAYRCESPHAPFDVVAYRDGQCYRVEVKSVSLDDNPGRAPKVTWPRNDEWDMLLAVDGCHVHQFAFGATREEVSVVLRQHHGFPAAWSAGVRNVPRLVVAECLARRAAGEELASLAIEHGIDLEALRLALKRRQAMPHSRLACSGIQGHAGRAVRASPLLSGPHGRGYGLGFQYG
jgi:hypothetical protein